MNFKRILSRRDFISYLFLGITSSYLLYAINKKDPLNIDPALKKEIDLFNYNRKDLLKRSLNSSIEDDLNNERTIWIGKKLFTYAEVR